MRYGGRGQLRGRTPAYLRARQERMPALCGGGDALPRGRLRRHRALRLHGWRRSDRSDRRARVGARWRAAVDHGQWHFPVSAPRRRNALRRSHCPASGGATVQCNGQRRCARGLECFQHPRRLRRRAARQSLRHFLYQRPATRATPTASVRLWQLTATRSSSARGTRTATPPESTALTTTPFRR